MADSNKPTHDVVAIMRETTREGDERSYFQELGPAWVTAEGNLSFTLRVVPVALLRGEPQPMLVTKRQTASERNDRPRSDSRGGRNGR